MSFVTWIVLGLLAGFIGSKIMDKQGQGLLLNIVLGVVGAIPLALVLSGCSNAPAPLPAEVKARPVLLPEPVVNHSPSDAKPGQKIEHGELIPELRSDSRTS